jgi:hypothetical protein
MTDPNRKSGAPVPAASAAHDPSFASSPRSSGGAEPTVAQLSRLGTRAAANDDGAASPHAIRNPIWIVVIGMACMFSVMALVIALE